MMSDYEERYTSNTWVDMKKCPQIKRAETNTGIANRIVNVDVPALF